MNIHQGLLAVENRIIDFLTAITWWAEVRFGKDNLYFAHKASAFVSLFMLFIGVSQMPVFIDQKEYVKIGLCAVAVLVTFSAFVLEIIFEDIAISILKVDNPQGNPNPCRIRKRTIIKRRICFTLLLVSMYYFVLGGEMVFLCFSLMCLFALTDTLLAACDSLSLQEKMRRQAQNQA